MSELRAGVRVSEEVSPGADRPARRAPARRCRLDQLLVARGLFPTRERARRAVMAGLVLVDGSRVDKAGTPVPPGAALALRDAGEPFVSRGGRKLAGALDRLAVDPAGWVCMDVGASTGGFTDCLLARGALRVYAIDVGHGQLDQGLRCDPRVTVMERVNARHLAPDALPERCRLATVDVSFISLHKVVPALLPHLTEDGELLLLIKPQFEAGPRQVGKGGVIRDEGVREAVVSACLARLAELGLSLRGRCDSAVAGASGNREVFALLGGEGRAS